MSNVNDNPQTNVSVNLVLSHLSDIGNAKLFASLHGKDIRYCPSSRKWLIWDGKRWAEDTTGEIYRKVKDTAIKLLGIAARETDDNKRTILAKHAAKTQSASSLKAMIDLAWSEPGMTVQVEDLDSNPWLLNVLNGTLDLKTGDLRRHRREDLITKLIPIDYDQNASCPIWHNFLHRVTGGDKGLKRFLQKAVGYSLTGDTGEQVIFILYGIGANGKTTFLVTISSLLGDYARVTPTETLLIKRGDGIPNDVARLKGARFVSADESERGRHLAEVLVKRLTGGDTIAARFLYGEFFEFEPTFKLFLAVNHKPTIRGSDHAIWRRIRLIPFNVVIPPEEQYKNFFVEKLKLELPGILSWAVKGCLLWQREGLEVPDSVKAATADYRSEMDVISNFIMECCEVTPGVQTPFSDLYHRYQDWCIENQEEDKDQLGKKEFSQCLTELGFAAGRNGTLGRYRVGIRLR